MRPTRSEEGSGTVMALGVIGLVLLAFVAASMILSAVLASHRARSAADLAALAGAARLATSATDPCGEARRIAERHGAMLRACLTQGAELELEVTVTPAGAVSRFGDAVATARAGPG